MEKLKKYCAHHLLVLYDCFQTNFGVHYPKELVHLIVAFYYNLYKLRISIGEDHALLLFDGVVYSSGNNCSGQLGLSKTEKTKYLFQNIKLINIKKIACGFKNSIALVPEGSMCVWGKNDLKQLGISDQSDIYFPYPIPELDVPPIKKIVCGECHTIALTYQGEVYVWGYKYHKQQDFGNKDNFGPYLPTKLFFDNPIKKIACGSYHSMALTITGEVYTWGSNQFGQLGHNDESKKINLSNIKKISCGTFHSMAITTQGETYVWGSNARRKLGFDISVQIVNIPTKLNLPDLKKIIGGSYHTMALTKFGEVYVWGDNEYRYLGIDKYVYTGGLYKLDLPYVKDIICGYNSSMAITCSNEIYVWGDNSTGQLGLGHYKNVHSPQKLIFDLEQ
jgi:alpha-tubulin suppressor-like RCC1 family protein